jgi:C-terminal processing protease CtpA/Prc
VKVAPSSPASAAGIKAGGQIVDVAGHVVAGAQAREIQAFVEKQVGESLTVKVRRPDGKSAVFTLVAIAKPASP